MVRGSLVVVWGLWFAVVLMQFGTEQRTTHYEQEITENFLARPSA
jgi:hypothetical protein